MCKCATKRGEASKRAARHRCESPFPQAVMQREIIQSSKPVVIPYDKQQIPHKASRHSVHQQTAQLETDVPKEFHLERCRGCAGELRLKSSCVSTQQVKVRQLTSTPNATAGSGTYDNALAAHREPLRGWTWKSFLLVCNIPPPKLTSSAGG